VGGPSRLVRDHAANLAAGAELLQIGDMQHLWQFADDVLGPLIRYDASHKLGLVRTLSVFLNERESLKQAARRLHVHTNTVSYRLQRIEQLTPLNLADPEDRSVAHVRTR
jgi:PucR family transcriptional regulator, purine catabolism regulatory protein